MSDVAILVETLLARGVSLQVRGKKIAFSPKSAYNELSHDERLAFKEHKAKVVAYLLDRYQGTARGVMPQPPPEVAPVPEPEPPAPPPLCKWCDRAPCIGEQHAAYATLHPEAQPKATYDLAALCRSNEGLLITDIFSHSTTPPDDPTDVMLKRIGKLP